LASPNHSHPAKYLPTLPATLIPGNRRPKHHQHFCQVSAALPLSNGHLRPRSTLRSQSDRQDSNLHNRINEVTLVFTTGKFQSGNHRQEHCWCIGCSCRFAPNRRRALGHSSYFCARNVQLGAYPASLNLKQINAPSGGVPSPHAAPASCFGGKYLPSPPPTDRSSFCVASLQTASELRSGGKQLCSCYMRLGAQAGLAAASRVVVCDRGNKRPWFCRLTVEVATVFATRASSFSVAPLQTA